MGSAVRIFAVRILVFCPGKDARRWGFPMLILQDFSADGKQVSGGWELKSVGEVLFRVKSPEIS